MPWKESDSDNDSPDLKELFLSLKEKIKNSFKAKNHDDLEMNEEIFPVYPCSCDKENKEYFVDVLVKCKSCEKTVKHKKITSPYKVAAILVIVSYGVSQFADYAISDNRYPLDVEYAVMDSCTNSYEKPLARRLYGIKKSVCLCALEDTMNEISYVRYLVNEKGFITAFEENADNCIEQQK